MSTIAIRDRLVYPTAVVLALGATTVAPTHAPESLPRFAEVSAIRLQAEVTSYVSGLPDASLAGVASAPGAAASVSPAAAASESAVGDIWPSTFLDKLVASLPPQIQYAILPPLYVVMTVVGAIMGVFYLVFGFPKDLIPAAAVAPARARGAAASVAPESAAVQDDSPATSATPGATPSSDAAPGRTASEPAATPAAVSQAPSPGRPTRGRHAVPVDAAPDAVTGHAAAAAAIAEAPAVAEASAIEQALAHPSRGRSESADSESADSGSTDSAPARAAKRSAQ